ncbi:DNA-dependent ATPase protein rad54, partial [Serendipita sp. 397]
MYLKDPFKDDPIAHERGLVLVKPFKTPALAVTHQRDQPLRKRKRVSYKENGGGREDDEDESGKRATKRRKTGGNDDDDSGYTDEPFGDLAANINRSFPIYDAKPREVVFSKRFSIPGMKTKDGKVVNTALSRVALGVRPQMKLLPRPLHDPMADHAVVLYDPTVDDRETDEERQARLLEEAKEAAKKEAAEKVAGMYNPHKSLREILGENVSRKKMSEKVPVVIDPLLSKILRPHQIEGVKFLYRCTSGMVVENQYGCIMADGMGLGKTLQTISLIWTLLKQSPHASKPTIEKCVIACPSSLVRNWANELVKWLGKDAVGSFAIDGREKKADVIEGVRRWVAAKGRNVTLPVMIVSYETLRGLTTELANCEIGLLVCDEGHRLKNGDSLTFTALTALRVQRRVVLSGTPIQNDLSEYFSLLNFANPNYLGTRAEFRKNFENAIIRGRDADATDAVKEASEAKLKELGGLVAPFIIRRTNELLSKYRESSRLLPLVQDSYLTVTESAGQVRTGGVLSSIGSSIGAVPTLHLVLGNPK